MRAVSLAGLHVPVVGTVVAEVVGVVVAWKDTATCAMSRVLCAGKGLGEVGVFIGVVEGGGRIVVGGHALAGDAPFLFAALFVVIVGIVAKYAVLVLMECAV